MTRTAAHRGCSRASLREPRKTTCARARAHRRGRRSATAGRDAAHRGAATLGALVRGRASPRGSADAEVEDALRRDRDRRPCVVVGRAPVYRRVVHRAVRAPVRLRRGSDALVGTSVLLGRDRCRGERHAAASVEHQMRPLFGFFQVADRCRSASTRPPPDCRSGYELDSAEAVKHRRIDQAVTRGVDAARAARPRRQRVVGVRRNLRDRAPVGRDQAANRRRSVEP